MYNFCKIFIPPPPPHSSRLLSPETPFISTFHSPFSPSGSLSNIRVGGADGMFKSVSGADAQVQLANPSFATVLILDDDHAGFFGFDTREIEVVESIGEVSLFSVCLCLCLLE